MIEQLWRDLAYAVRGLRKTPGFTVVAVVTLALGIGVNSSIFSLVNALLLRPLPVADPGELVDVYGYPSNAGGHHSSSWPDFVDYREQASSLEDLMAYTNFFANMANEGRSELVVGEIVSDNYFQVLGIQPRVGRSFVPEEFVTERTHPVVILGHELWKTRFGADPGILGTTVSLNGTPYDVIGVGPEGFGGMMPAVRAQMWIPAMMVEEVEPLGNQRGGGSGESRLEERDRRWLWMRGRLAEGATVTQAQTELDGIAARLRAEYPESNELEAVALVATDEVRINPDLDATMAPAGAFILAVAALVLLVACANLANMLLARASSRAREIAVRLSIGATRRRLLGQLMTESLLLALIGGLAGVGLAALLTRLLVAYQPPLPIDLGLEVGIDWRVLLFALGASAATGIAFGLVPAWRASRPNLVSALKEGSSHDSGGRGRLPLRDALVVVQLAFSLVLLVAGTLMARSLSEGYQVDFGYDIGSMNFIAIGMEMNGYDADRSEIFHREALQRLRALPNVEAVAMASRVPLSVNDNNWGLFIDGHQSSPTDRPYLTPGAYVDPDYFGTYGLSLIQGRDFVPEDALDDRRVAVITEAMAERYWPEGNAVGQPFRSSWEGAPWEVIGVVENYKVNTPGEAPAPYLHLPLSPRTTFANFIVRTNGDGAVELPAVERELYAIDPQLVFLDSGPYRELADVRLLPIRLGAVFIGAFGLLALAIAAVGLYGVIGYSVARRTREIGIRVALGAERGSVIALVMRRGLVLIGLGGLVGAGLAVAVGSLLSGVLFVSSFDPVSFLGAFAALGAVALLANWIPARRASRVDPIKALRSE